MNHLWQIQFFASKKDFICLQKYLHQKTFLVANKNRKYYLWPAAASSSAFLLIISQNSLKSKFLSILRNYIEALKAFILDYFS